MERDEGIASISKFGRLRKVSTKLIDLPMRSTNNGQNSSLRSMGSPSKRLAHKTEKLSVDPFVDFEAEKFNELLSSEYSTDTSSSVGENDENDVVNEVSNAKKKVRKTFPMKPKKDCAKKVEPSVDASVDFQPEKFNEILPLEDTTDTSSSAGENDENVVGKALSNGIVTRQSTANLTRQRTANRKLREKKKTINDRCGRSRGPDRGQSRCTAYSLWAKEARLKLLTKRPNRNNSDVSRQLGKMWSNISMSVKSSFKQKAALENSKIKKNSTSDCQIPLPIEVIWLVSKY